MADLWAKNWVPYVIQIQLKQGYNDFEYYKNVIKSLIFFGNRTFTNAFEFKVTLVVKVRFPKNISDFIDRKSVV